MCTDGQSWAVLVRMEDRRECFDRQIASRCRERARRVYYGAVFEVKKEIPIRDDNILSWLFLAGRFWLRYWVRWLLPSP